MSRNASVVNAPELDAAGFAALFERLRGRADWGEADRRGALNYITPSTVRAAMEEVRLGRSVSLAVPVSTDVTVDNPQPWRHEMISSPADHRDEPGVHFAFDRLAMNVHGNADTHLDALCHVIYDGKLYNGVQVDAVERDGAPALSVDVMRDGIVGRGVLLDIPRVREERWLRPGDQVTAADLVAAEEAQHVQVKPGDLLFVRVGHRRRRKALGPWDTASARAGLHPTALEYVADRQVAVLGSDGNNDTAPPSGVVDFPVHVLAVNALGVPLIDYLYLEDLRTLCAQHDRWSFLCVVAPLRIPAGTGSPVNPIAVL
ncbi:kynurenine formamidase [Hamadaea flava]|uniref:Cyclase family protein n=1 Tax=Hamadaea flava TaxID=1742688 RepID=A0ABV8LY22_9ACTN|nr:cyclase family protein [Hamadaea flava]MCP2328932.1 kynurenine formamidase [Hamadaea flava]